MQAINPQIGVLCDRCPQLLVCVILTSDHFPTTAQLPTCEETGVPIQWECYARRSAAASDLAGVRHAVHVDAHLPFAVDVRADAEIPPSCRCVAHLDSRGLYRSD
jgi:hypothetical protein